MSEYSETKNRILTIYNEFIGLENQKDFALSIIPKTFYSFERGILFEMRKNGRAIDDILKDIGPNKISKGMSLREKFSKKFNIIMEDEDTN
jgi:hypothetical protein